ncbi:MAG: hypothetical protein ABUJ98_10595, partial [Hyphomicrobium sp.]
MPDQTERITYVFTAEGNAADEIRKITTAFDDTKTAGQRAAGTFERIKRAFRKPPNRRDLYYPMPSERLGREKRRPLSPDREMQPRIAGPIPTIRPAVPVPPLPVRPLPTAAAKDADKAADEEADKLTADEKKRYAKLSKSFGKQSGKFFEAAITDGDLPGFFSQAGTSLASTIIASLAAAGLTQLLTGGGFLSTFLSGFQQEGLVRRPTIAAIAERAPEVIMRQSTLRAIAGGFSPRGGRSDARYGPDDY